VKIKYFIPILLIVLVFSFLLIGCGDPYKSKEAKSYLTEASKKYSNFMEKYMLANSTSRMNLTPIIAEMQNIKIEFSEIEPPKKYEDLQNLKKLCTEGMDNVIKGFIAFQSQEDDSTTTSYFQIAETRFNDMDVILKNYEDGLLFTNSRFNFFQSQSSETIDTTPKLQLLDYSQKREYDYIIVEGQVKNISSETLKNVEAVVEYYDESDNFIKEDSALIEYNPILPNQTSAFKVMGTDNPLIKRYAVSFKDLTGGKINHIK
jgi:hypothetical protein